MRGKTKSLFPLNFFFKEQSLELPLSYKSALPFISCISKVCWRSSGLFEAFSLGHEACEHGPTLGTKSTQIFFFFLFALLQIPSFCTLPERPATCVTPTPPAFAPGGLYFYLFIYFFLSSCTRPSSSQRHLSQFLLEPSLAFSSSYAARNTFFKKSRRGSEPAGL